MHFKMYFIIICVTFTLQVTIQDNVGPTIIVNPKNTVATTGSNISLYCIVRGDPKPDIAWTKDGALLTGKHFLDGPKLTIYDVKQLRDEGKYECVVSNAVGTVVSLGATLAFPFLGKFSTPFSNKKANDGDPLVLRCDPPKAIPLTTRSLRWSKRDINFPSLLPPLEKKDYYSVSKIGDLHFSYVTSTDIGNYVCIVGNTMLGHSEERTVKLKVDFTDDNKYHVRKPDIFEDFTTPKFALKDKPFVLECITQGRPVPRISLKKLGTHVELGTTTANKRTHIIRRFGQQDAGDYVCRTSNDYGDSSEKTTTVHMLVEAKWVSQLRDTSADVNSSHTWQCEADGIPPIRYQWFYNGQQIIDSPKYHIDQGTMELPILRSSDSGMYQCSASNDVKSLMASAELDVRAALPSFPKGAHPPRRVSAVKGNVAEMKCEPAGAPTPTTTWYKDSTILKTTAKYQLTDKGTLTIKNIEKNDQGSYSCQAKNALGTAKKNTYLWVKDGVVIVNFPKRLTCVVGNNLTLACQADIEKGTIVSFEWKQNYMANIESNVAIQDDITARRSTLTIVGATLRNNAIYSCTATVRDGNIGAKTNSDTAEAIVKVEGPPNAPISVNVSYVVNHRVTVTWITRDSTRNNNNNVIIEYRTLYEPDVWYTAENVKVLSANSAEVKLSPWAFYRFQVILENSVGRSKPSPESALVECPASVPHKAPSNITGKGATSTELTISWKALKPIAHNGPGLHYAVFYRKVKDPAPMTRVEIRTKSESGKPSYTLTNTDYFEQFEFQVQAINALGSGPKSAVVYGYSGEKAPVGEPKDLRVQILNSRSARATWTGIRKNREAARGQLLGYKVYYWSALYGLRPSDAQYEPTDTTTTMLGLDSFTTYFFQVVAYNGKGDGPGSNVVGPLSTPETVPQAPFSLDVHVSNPEVTLKWKPPRKTNGIMVGYQVTVKKLPMGQVNIIDVNHERLEQVFEALDLNAKYQFALLARNRVGFGPPLVVNFDLNTVPKRAPDDVFLLVDDKRRSVTVKWSKVSVKVNGYRVSYWNTKDGIEKSMKFREIDSSSERKVSIANLDRQLTYKLHVSSFQEYGDNLVFGPKTKIYTITLGKIKTLGSSNTGCKTSISLFSLLPLIFTIFCNK